MSSLFDNSNGALGAQNRMEIERIMEANRRSIWGATAHDGNIPTCISAEKSNNAYPHNQEDENLLLLLDTP